MMPRTTGIRGIMDETGLSRTTTWRMVRDHDFPVPLKPGVPNTGTVGRREADVEAWPNGLGPIDNQEAQVEH